MLGQLELLPELLLEEGEARLERARAEGGVRQHDAPAEERHLVLGLGLCLGLVRVRVRVRLRVRIQSTAGVSAEQRDPADRRGVPRAVDDEGGAEPRHLVLMYTQG